MAKQSKGKSTGNVTVGRSAPGRANAGVPSPAAGVKVKRAKPTANIRTHGKPQTLANGTRTGVMTPPSGGIA